MDIIVGWSTQFVDAALDAIGRLIEYLPQAFGVVLLLLAGWVVGRIGRVVVSRLIKGLNHVRSRIAIAGNPVLPRISDAFAAIIGKVVFWLIVLVFVTIATDLMGLGMFASWLNLLINHLPNILSGILIMWAGIVFSGLVSQAVGTAAINLAEFQRQILARIARILTLVVLIVIGVDQIGIDITIVITIISISLAAALGGVAIAFSLGARQLVSNLIAVRYLDRHYRYGERVRIGEYEGTVIEITAVAVVLDTEHGRVTVPARLFSEQPSVLIARAQDDV